MKSLERGWKKQKTKPRFPRFITLPSLRLPTGTRVGGRAARRECSWEVPISGRGYRAAAAVWCGGCVCISGRELGAVPLLLSFTSPVNLSSGYMSISLFLTQQKERFCCSAFSFFSRIHTHSFFSLHADYTHATVLGSQASSFTIQIVTYSPKGCGKAGPTAPRLRTPGLFFPWGK